MTTEPPKRPINATFRYLMEKRPDYMKKNPSVKITEATKILSAEFSKLSEKEKEKYVKAYQAEKQDYDKVESVNSRKRKSTMLSMVRLPRREARRTARSQPTSLRSERRAATTRRGPTARRRTMARRLLVPRKTPSIPRAQTRRPRNKHPPLLIFP